MIIPRNITCPHCHQPLVYNFDLYVFDDTVRGCLCKNLTVEQYDTQYEVIQLILEYNKNYILTLISMNDETYIRYTKRPNCIKINYNYLDRKLPLEEVSTIMQTDDMKSFITSFPHLEIYN